MRAFKLILAGLFAALAAAVALAAGLFAAAVVAITGLGVYLTRRFLGRTTVAPSSAAPRSRAQTRSGSEAIDITATEIATTDESEKPALPHER